MNGASESTPAETAARPAASNSFLERYRLLFNRRGECWWSIVFGYPVARFLVAILADVRWITPTALTVVGFAVKLAAAFAIFASAPAAADPTLAHHLIAAAILLQVAQVLDSMDGTLARYRSQSSPLGAFLDKVTDAVGLFAITVAVGWFALAATLDPVWLLLPTVGGAAFVTLCYMFWVARNLRPPTAQTRAVSGETDALSWQRVARQWLLGWWRIILVQEADLYFWIALLLLTGHIKTLCLVILISQTVAVLFRFSMHVVALTERPTAGPPP